MPSIACRFQVLISVRCTPCLLTSSATAASPRIASSATFALNPALYRFPFSGHSIRPSLPADQASPTVPIPGDHLTRPGRRPRSPLAFLEDAEVVATDRDRLQDGEAGYARL